MHVIVIVYRLQKVQDFLAVRLRNVREIFCDVTDFRSNDIPTGRFQCFGHVVQVLDFGQEPRALCPGGNLITFQRLDFLRASFNRVSLRVAVGVHMRGFDDAEMIEEKRDTSRLSERTGLAGS